MKVEVLFKSHRYEEFDSSTQTCSEPYRGKGLNVLTDWNLYLGSLEGRTASSSCSTGMTGTRHPPKAR